jgi:hypothetical protein
MSRSEIPNFATYLSLAASTGARRSQLLGLRWAEIDGRHAAIGFARAYVEGPAGPVLRATKTHRTYRVAIDDITIQRLIRHRRRDEEHAAANGIELPDRAFVFSADRDGSTPWLPNRVTKTFLANLSRAGVGRFRLHDLRHFMATQVLAHGVAVVTVSQRLGHARASTTLNLYGHCIPGADRDAAHLSPTSSLPLESATWAEVYGCSREHRLPALPDAPEADGRTSTTVNVYAVPGADVHAVQRLPISLQAERTHAAARRPPRRDRWARRSWDAARARVVPNIADSAGSRLDDDEPPGRQADLPHDRLDAVLWRAR